MNWLKYLLGWSYAEITYEDGSTRRVYADWDGAIRFRPILLITPYNKRSVTMKVNFNLKVHHVIPDENYPRPRPEMFQDLASQGPQIRRSVELKPRWMTVDDLAELFWVARRALARDNT